MCGDTPPRWENTCKTPSKRFTLCCVPCGRPPDAPRYILIVERRPRLFSGQISCPAQPIRREVLDDTREAAGNLSSTIRQATVRHRDGHARRTEPDSAGALKAGKAAIRREQYRFVLIAHTQHPCSYPINPTPYTAFVKNLHVAGVSVATFTALSSVNCAAHRIFFTPPKNPVTFAPLAAGFP